jgi:hypothetical protein
MRKTIRSIWFIGLTVVLLWAACEAQQAARPTLHEQAIQVADRSQEPVAPLWILSIAHSLAYQNDYHASQLQLSWSGSFVVTGGQIAGSGIGQISGQHGCGDDRDPEYDVTGEFTFQITGRQVTRSDGRPLFQLLIEGQDLTLHSDAKCAANFYEIAVASRLQSLAEQLPSLVEHIEIEGRAGATATIPLPDALALFGKTPLKVELTSAPGK